MGFVVPPHLLGEYNYKLKYDGKPAYKHNQTRDVYLYWNPEYKTWMLGSGVLSHIPFFWSSCEETYPENCKERWENAKHVGNLAIRCVSRSISPDSKRTKIPMKIILGSIAGAVILTLLLASILLVVARKKDIERTKKPSYIDKERETSSGNCGVSNKETNYSVKDGAIIVTSYELTDHTIVVRPLTNPYYEDENTCDVSNIRDSICTDLIEHADMVKVVKNIYYE